MFWLWINDLVEMIYEADENINNETWELLTNKCHLDNTGCLP